MKLKYLLLTSAVSFSLSSVAFAAAQQEMPGGGETPEAHSAPAMPEQDQEVVRKVQKKLNDEGYNAGPTDGSWGPGTQSALTQFQQAEGLRATGALDQDTLRALGIEE